MSKSELVEKKHRNCTKTLNGNRVSTDAFRRAIAETIRKRGGSARVRDIVADLKTDYYRDVYRAIKAMIALGWLEQPSRGVYALSEHFDHHFKFGSTEWAAIDSFRERGGIMKRVLLMRDFDLHENAEGNEAFFPETNFAEYRDLKRVLERLIKNGVLTRFYNRKAHYRLPWGELLNLPLPGKYVPDLILNLFADNNRHLSPQFNAIKTASPIVPVFFQKVGYAFRKVREMYGLFYDELLAADPEIEAIFTQLWDDATNCVYVIKARVKEECTERAIRACGGTLRDVDEVAIQSEASALLEKERLLRLVMAFEAGTYSAHTNAPTDLFYTYARVFGVDPIALSRGVVKPVTPEAAERLKDYYGDDADGDPNLAPYEATLADLPPILTLADGNAPVFHQAISAQLHVSTKQIDDLYRAHRAGFDVTCLYCREPEPDEDLEDAAHPIALD